MKKIYAFLFCLISLQLSAQQNDRIHQLATFLDSLTQVIPRLEDSVNLSLQDVPLHEYVRAIGQAHQLNVFIENTPGLRMTQQLRHEPVKSVFLFICQQYHYDIRLQGRIITFFPYQSPPELAKKLNISFSGGKLSMDLRQDSLLPVIREISRQTGEKIIVQLGCHRSLTFFLSPSTVELGLELLAKANDLKLSRNRKGYFVLAEIEGHQTAPGTPPAQTVSRQNRENYSVEVFTDAEEQLLSIHAVHADLGGLLREIFSQAQTDHFMLGEPEGQISVQLEAAQLEEVLTHILRASPFSYKKSGRFYLIGPEELPDMQSMEIVELKYRPTSQALSLIPGAEPEAQQHMGLTSRPTPMNRSVQPGAEETSLSLHRRMIDGVEVIEYPELNKIILRGPEDHVYELVEFLEEIDQPIPMVKVELIVIELSKNSALQTGIRAGLGRLPDSARKDLLPGLDYSLDGQNLNHIFRNSPSPFLQSLGVLNPDFYVQLKAQESLGNLEVVMSPMLSMLNGREATLTIGQKQYYLLETTTASNGAVNNYQQFSQQFTEIEANISLSIRPFISDGDMVTLDIVPDFSTPVGGFVAGVPPTIATRKFDSSIRVRNGETFILGGLTQEEKQEKSSGLPVLGRIPLLKWIFANQSKSKGESSLVIYVTPHIYYQ
jgi:type IV pilus assembly protein PilQ